MSVYKWIYQKDGSQLFSVGILKNGTLYNPNDYPRDIVHAAVLAADARRKERRRRAAHKAAVTRQARQEKKVAEAAQRIAAGLKIGKQDTCWICGKALDDPESME